MSDQRPQDDDIEAWPLSTEQREYFAVHLERDIIQRLYSRGEIDEDSFSLLQQTADLIGLSAQDLHQQIAQVMKSCAQQSPGQKAFQLWVEKLNDTLAQKTLLTVPDVAALLHEGVAATGKTSAELEAILEQKGIDGRTLYINTYKPRR